MQIYLKTNLFIILSCMLFLPQQAFALGKVGHKVVCQLAFDHLTPNTQHKVNALLKELPQQHKKLINQYNHKHTNANITFAETCTWADAIKKDKSYNQYKKWHYVNVARNQTIITPQTCHKNCVTSAVKHHTEKLAKLPTSWDKLQALMFLGHWIGDIHQPMHVNFASDLGGNRTKISLNSSQNKVKCNNMHWLWDECLLYSNSTSSNAELFNYLYHKLSKQWELAPTSEWQNDTLYTWATESLTIARLPSVLYCTVNAKNDCVPIQSKKLHLPSNYQSQHTFMLEKRLLQAAVRLVYTVESHL